MSVKVKVIGTSNNWTKDPCTNFVIELDGCDQILFDVGCGTSKFVQNKKLLSCKDLIGIIISHFHIDHFGDIVNIIENVEYYRPTRKIQLIGPKNLKKKVLDSFKIYCDDYNEQFEKRITNTFVAHEVEDGDVIRLGKYEDIAAGGKFVPSKYELVTFKVEHLVPCLGYVLRNRETNTCIGFPADTCDCENLRKIIEMSSTIFIDTSYLKKTKTHLSLPEVLDFVKKYPDKKFYCVHLREETIKEINQKYSDVLQIPKDNEIIEID